MVNTKHIGRIGALAVALGVGFALAATPEVAHAEPTDAATCQSPDSAEHETTALILGGTTVPTPDDAYIDTVKKHFIAPTHAGQTINNYCAVTAPMQAWPVTGIGRLGWFAVGPESIWGPGGPAWPDEPWWKLSGLFDLTLDQSVRAGVSDLEAAMAEHPNDHLVIYGYSQGAIIANLEKRKLAEQYPVGSATPVPDIDFVLSGDPNIPNGGIAARFPGLYIPILDVSLNGSELTDTQFDTIVITRQYDGFSDFPLYPLNVISLANALLGAVYLHPYDLDVSLPAEPDKSRYYQGAHGRTSYYFFETEDLPLFAPLRSLGVPEPVIDIVEPSFRVIVELGYDRDIRPWEPTPARLIPSLNPGKVAADLVDAVGEGINNAAALIGSKSPLTIPETPTTADRNAAVQQEFSGPTSTVEGIDRDGTDGAAQVLNGAEPLLKKHLASTRDRILQRTSAGADPARRTPVRDAVSDLRKAVKTASHNLKKTLSGGRVDNNHTVDRSPGGAQ